MEELLSKNIFDDKELAKLSPDYTPSNFLVRMNMRDTMVKDTHSHKYKGESWQRKTIKRPKDCHNINKEILKIRNGYQSLNLKNQIMLKNAAKYVDTLKPEDFVNYSDNEFETLKKDTEAYLQDITEKNKKLVVKNDVGFRINNKLKRPKLNTEIRSIKRALKKNLQLNDSSDVTNVNWEVKDLLKIKCSFLKSEVINKDTINKETDDFVESKSTQFDYDLELSTPRKVVEKDMNDLQDLTVMMAISPSSKENNSDTHFKQVSIREVEYDDKELILDPITPIKNAIEQAEDVIEFINITSWRIEITDPEKKIVKKYIEKWKAHVLKQKQYILSRKREETLNSFFDKLAKKQMDVSQSPEPINKAKLIGRDFNRYQHRYQMQKHIIALQKAKLEEQNRIIEELKYNRIIDASRHSIDAMREEVRKTYYGIDKQLKPKIKSLTKELNLDIEEPSLVLHCLKVPQFLQRMEKRAREREEKHAIIRERRKQMEEERIRLKQQEEITKAQMDKEEKIKRMKELKDKRKREKIEGIRKKQHTERMRALTVMAELHYEKVLMSKYGIRPLRILMEIKKDNYEKSRVHYNFQLKKNVFLNWMWYIEDMLYERNYRAEDCYRKKLLRAAFGGLKQYHHNYVLKKQVAEDYYDLYVVSLVFRKFREALRVIKGENERKWQIAVIYHNSNLLFKTFICWRSLPALNALRREQEARKARWREKVLQVVPDYTPPDE